VADSEVQSMSRSGYSDDLDDWQMIKWRGQVASAIRGRRGQKFLAELLNALDALPQKRLIPHELKREDGEVCAMGALAVARNLDMEKIDPDEPEEVAAAFDIAHQLAQEVAYMNDEWRRRETPEERYARMKDWVTGLVKGVESRP
jgi:hypothetical protein